MDDRDRLPKTKVVELGDVDRPTVIARTAVQDVFLGQGGQQLDNAVVVVNELVVNAVQHTPGPDCLVIYVFREFIQLWVYDRSPDCADVRSRNAADDDTDGRGLSIVDELSSTWFVLPTLDGKVVVAVLLLPPDKNGISCL